MNLKCSICNGIGTVIEVDGRNEREIQCPICDGEGRTNMPALAILGLAMVHINRIIRRLADVFRR